MCPFARRRPPPRAPRRRLPRPRPSPLLIAFLFITLQASGRRRRPPPRHRRRHGLCYHLGHVHPPSRRGRSLQFRAMEEEPASSMRRRRRWRRRGRSLEFVDGSAASSSSPPRPSLASCRQGCGPSHAPGAAARRRRVPAYDGAIVMVWAGQFRGNRRAKKVANGLGKRSYVGIHESEDVCVHPRSKPVWRVRS